MDEEEGRAAIWKWIPRPAQHASSPPVCAIRSAWPGSPERGVLWAVVNERDELGSDLVPDYMTRSSEGGFYGWPYSYYGQHVDKRVKPQRPELVARAIVPDYALGPHTASLGLPSARRQRSARASPTACSSASTAPGTETAERLQGDLRAVRERRPGRRAAGRADAASSTHEAMRGAARSAWRSTRAAALLVADDVGNAVWRVAADAAEGAAPPIAQRSAAQLPRASASTAATSAAGTCSGCMCSSGSKWKR